MASRTARSAIDQVRTAPLPVVASAAAALLIWVAGAAYCSGYERLSSGFDNWPGSLWWSAVAVLPWFALFEWSKTSAGRRYVSGRAKLGVLLLGTAVGSLLLEYLANALLGDPQFPLALAMMRRLPAIVVSLLLILWARTVTSEQFEPDQSLAQLAGSIDWVAAADNYVELHIGGRVVMRRMTMRDAEKALASRGFARIHRCYLVNRRCLAAVTGNGAKRIRLPDGTELPVGPRYAANLVNFAPSPHSG